MTFLITYQAYSGRVVTTTVESEDDIEAVNIAFLEEGNYSSDSIYKIISIEEI